MTDASVSNYYMSEKFSKVSWVPEEYKNPDRFLTGSWDMAKNNVRLWRLQPNPYAEECDQIIPQTSDHISFKADISGIKFVDDDNFAVGRSDGRISLLTVHRAVEEDQLKNAAESELLHSFMNGAKPAPCTDISVFGDDIATVGEDGCLNILSASNLAVPKRSIGADSCSIYCVEFVQPQEVITANRMGVIRMFDVRANTATTPTMSFMCSCKDEKASNYVSCLTTHPTQKHILLAGTEEGSIVVWDLRQPSYPATYLSAHNSPITDLSFHRQDPTKLFSAAESGELWMWTEQTLFSAMETDDADEGNLWLNGDRAKNRLSISSLISNLGKAINSFDSYGPRLVCGSDSEAIYIIDNVY